MKPITPVLIVLGIVWIGGGTLWLLRHRRYSWRRAHHFLVDLLGFPVEWAQATWGRGGVPYALLLPNMLIFGTFTFLPLLLNLHVSFTGGDAINLVERPWVGTENYRQLFDCESILEPRTCPAAGYNFWTGMFNTFVFVLIQVPVLCAVSLVTALVVDRVLRGRGFWRAMFFYPVMLSPVVIANIWQWVLHRKGVLNTTLDAADERLGDLVARAGFDVLATVVMAILLMVAIERTLRSERGAPARREESVRHARAPGDDGARRAAAALSVPWAAVFCLLLMLTLLWSNAPTLLGESFAAWSTPLAILVPAFVFWLVADARPLARPALVAASLLAVALLLTIQFDAVFDFGDYRPVNWLVTPRTGWPFFWLVFVYTWHHMGFYMLILLAGLQAIPRDLYEAARMDAATPFRTFWKITFPLLMPTFTVVLVLSLIKSFQVFDEVYTLTGGGPGRETFMIVQYIFESAFTGAARAYGEAAAGSVVMALVIAVLTLGQLWLTRRQSGI